MQIEGVLGLRVGWGQAGCFRELRVGIRPQAWGLGACAVLCLVAQSPRTATP